MSGTITEAIAASVVSSSSERDSSVPAPASRSSRCLRALRPWRAPAARRRAAARVPPRCRVRWAGGGEQAPARPPRSRRRPAARPRPARHGRAPAAESRRRAIGGAMPRDTQPRRDSRPGRARAGCRRRRRACESRKARSAHGRGHAERHGPAAPSDARHGGLHLRAFERRRRADDFAALAARSRAAPAAMALAKVPRYARARASARRAGCWNRRPTRPSPRARAAR